MQATIEAIATRDPDGDAAGQGAMWAAAGLWEEQERRTIAAVESK